MSAVVSKKKRDRQSASQAPARHSGEGRNPGSVTPSRLENGWTRVPLAKVGEWRGGGTPSKTNPAFWESGHIPWVSPKDMKSDVITDTQDHITEEAVTNSATNLVDAGSVLLVVRSGILQHTLPVAITSRQVALNQDIKAVRPRKEIRADYLALVLKAREREILHRCTKTGTTVQSLELPVFLRFEIPVAPPEEQPRIVAEIEKQFTRLDAGVAALRRVQANLKRYRAAVLKAACEGRLVPTEAELAKAEGRTCETGEQLLARILADRRKNWHGRGKYKEPAASDVTNLPPLPDGWAWASVEQLADIGSGNTPAKISDYAKPSGAVPWFKVGDMNRIGNERVMRTAEAYLRHEDVQALGLRLFSSGTIVFPKRGGAIATNKKRLLEAAATTDLNVMGLTPDVRVFGYFTHWFASVDLASLSDGSNVPQVNNKDIQPLQVPLPPPAEQTRIVAEVERRLSVIEELEAAVTANLRRATRLRQSVLARAFSSEQVTQEKKNSNNDVLDLKAERKKRHFARALLSAEIVHRLHDEPTFGRIKHQKIFHLCEHIARIDEIQGQYHREAAGPLDNKLIYANEAELKKQKWYEEVRRTQFGHAYHPLAKAGGHKKYIEKYWPDKLPVIERLIGCMRRWDTDQCEMFSTVYAAWNDLLIMGREPTEAAILHEVLACWHENKKRFPRDRWRKVIVWIKENGYAPTGFGTTTVCAKPT